MAVQRGLQYAGQGAAPAGMGRADHPGLAGSANSTGRAIGGDDAQREVRHGW